MAPVIAAVAKVVVAAIAKVTIGAIAKFVVTTALSIGISKLIAKRAMSGADAGGDGGGRVQLPPATDNKLPVVYGTAFIGGSIIDAMLSNDQKTMWYVVALAEHSDDQGGGGGGYTFDTNKCYYDGKLIEFGVNGAVTGLITNNSDPLTAQKDTRVNGFLYIYLFNNGSSSGINTGGQTAAQILSTVNGVPAAQAWGANQTMTNCAFAIIKVVYNVNAGITSAGSLTVNITNSITKPGDAIKDYMLNDRYGCAIPLARIDTASLTDLNTYSDTLIDYKPEGWNPGDPYDQQARYRINGPIDTSQNCLDNLQRLVDSCDSWLQYSELTGLWRVVINKGYTQSPNATTLNNLFLVNDDNLVGGIDISPLDLNETYNQIEVAYPNTNIKDQTDYQIIDLFQEDPQILSENEAVNRLNVTLPCVNNAVQARYLAARRIYQSREDLVISFRLDFNGIQLEAGDVIRVTHPVYGWTNKLFRVNVVAEEKDSTGNLFVVVQAFEYTNDIYDDIVEDYVPTFNTGLKDPNVIDIPGTPTAVTNPDTDGVISSFTVTSYVPNFGTVTAMDFNYGNNSNAQTHQLYRKVQTADGLPFVNSDTANSVYNNVNVVINDLPAGNYYFSTVARNDIAGRLSASSNLFFWTGANVNLANIIAANGVYSVGNILTSNNAIPNLVVNANVYITGGVGTLANNTYITSITSTSPTANFTVTPTPLSPLINASIEVISGGISGNAITPNTMPGNRVVANTMNGNVIIANTLNGNVLITGTVNGNVIIANTLNGNTIIANTINGNTIIANTLNGNTIIANTLNGNTITANTLNGNVIIANTLNGNTVTANTLNGNTIIANTLNGNTITANTLNGNTITANTLNGNVIIANTIDGNTILANTLNGNVIISNTVNGNTIIGNTLNGNVIIANTVDGGVIIGNTIIGNKLVANTITANQIAANAITAGKIDANAVTAGTVAANAITAGTIAANAVTAGTVAANAITAGTIAANAVTSNTIAANSITSIKIAANTVTTEQLVIGSVTQARSTIQEATVQPIPFTNIGNAWPDNTRAIVPAGGVTIIPTTDPNSSANIEYQEGSRIQVGFTVKLYTDPVGANVWETYNLVELWKSGASDQFDKGFNTVRHSYNDSTYGRTQTMHAYGYGNLDLYSSDGGNTWGTYSSQAPNYIYITGAVNYATASTLDGLETYNVGPLQDPDNNGIGACAGQRSGNTGSASQLGIDENLPYLSSTNLKLDMNGMEVAPGTGTNTPGSDRELLGVADNGTIFWSPTGTFTTTATTTEGVANNFQNWYGIYANPANGTHYTAIAVGGAGNIARADRTLNTGATWLSKSTYIGGNISTPVLSALYGIAGDDSVQSSTSKWVSVGQYGMIQVSVDDGDTWTQVMSPVVSDLNGVRYGNGTWLVVGDAGTILKNTGNILTANDWIQVNTSNINYANGTNYGNIANRDLVSIDYSSTYDKFNIGGVGMLLRTGSGTITPVITYEQGPSETYDLTRMTYFGSWPNVQTTTQPLAQQRVVNNQVFSYSVIDTDYVQGQETTYYLVVGNLAGRQIYVGQAYLNVQEIKR